MPNLIAFFKASTKESLNSECAMIAERWNWSDEQIRLLPTLRRREYLDIIIDLYEKEKEAMDRANRARR